MIPGVGFHVGAAERGHGPVERLSGSPPSGRTTLSGCGDRGRMPEGFPAGKARRMGIIRGMNNVFLIGLVSFFADFSTEMVYPIIPLYLTATFGATA